MNRRDEPHSWMTALSSRIAGGETAPGGSGEGNLAEAAGRTLLVAKVRWMLLALLMLYGVVAGCLFSGSRFGFFLTPVQIGVLVASVIGVITYNATYHFAYDRIRHLPGIDPLQVLLDFLFITLLIHFSGGGASWFWPVFLLATLEAAVLLPRREEVLLVGALGGLLYGLLLVGEYFGLFVQAKMPFVDHALRHDGLFLVLIWLWVALLNGAVALIGAYLMEVIRGENRALRESEERLFQFLDTASDLIFCLTPRGRFLYANQSWHRALGYGREELPGLNMLDTLEPESRPKCLSTMGKLLAGEPVHPIEGRFIDHQGRLLEVEGNISANAREGGETVIWVICRDITDRKKAERQLYHLAHHDMLTGLPNRMHFIDHLKQARALAKRLDHPMGVLFLDLDRFKLINDTLGHAVGDKLLQEVADRLSRTVREIDTVARLGGDEFIVALTNLTGPEDAERIARKILEALAEPVVIDGHELFITTSIGISVFPTHGDDPVGLVKKADIAMYHAKSMGRNNCQFFDPEMSRDAERRVVLERGLRLALPRNELRLLYQPKVDIATEHVTALEALLRWEHPDMGLLKPAEFLSLAEESGLILPIGEWVLRQVCAQIAAWQREGIPTVRVAVNLSGYQLQQSNLVEIVSQALEESGLGPGCLELEVTETVIMQNPDFADRVLKELRALGVRLAIDDFGTGYSSLSHLKRFGVDTLKIDKSFVRDVASNPTDAAIASAIIAMGKSLNLQVIAEGVEREDQMAFLRTQDCQEVQGYLFSVPLPPEEAAEFMRGRPSVAQGK